MSEYVSVSAVQYIAEDESNLEQQRAAGIIWSIRLPERIDPDRLEVNVSRLARIHKIGGFTGSFIREYQGKTTETTGINSINADGSATASKSKVVKAEKSKSSLFDPTVFGSFMSFKYGHPVAVHSINQPELVQNIIAKKSEGKDEHKAWASELDIALRGSLRRASYDNLVGRGSWVETFYDSALMSTVALDAVSSGLNGHTPYLLLSYPLLKGSCAGLQSAVVAKFTGTPNWDMRRHSLGLLTQLDRHLALKVATLSPGLVRSKK